VEACYRRCGTGRGMSRDPGRVSRPGGPRTPAAATAGRRRSLPRAARTRRGAATTARVHVAFLLAGDDGGDLRGVQAVEVKMKPARRFTLGRGR